LQETSPEQVYEIYRLRDWIEHSYKPAKHKLSWADYQMRPEQAIVRHWHLVMLAFTFSLLMGSPPAPHASTPPAAPQTADEAVGKKSGTRRRETADLGRDLACGAPMALSLGPYAAPTFSAGQALLRRLS
jgi:hypothetical protein